MKKIPIQKASPGCALAVLRKVLLVATAITMSLSAYLCKPLLLKSVIRIRSHVSSMFQKNGNNTDGLTWATAWNEMDQIKWTGIDFRTMTLLTIDGGVGRMIHRKPMA